jgi:hypothetical protein
LTARGNWSAKANGRFAGRFACALRVMQASTDEEGRGWLIWRIGLEQECAARLQPRTGALVQRRAERRGEVNEDGADHVERAVFGVEILLFHALHALHQAALLGESLRLLQPDFALVDGQHIQPARSQEQGISALPSADIEGMSSTRKFKPALGTQVTQSI